MLVESGPPEREPAMTTETPTEIGETNALMAIDQAGTYPTMEQALDAYLDNVKDSVTGYEDWCESVDAFKAIVKSKLGHKAPKGWR